MLSRRRGLTAGCKDQCNDLIREIISFHIEVGQILAENDRILEGILTAEDFQSYQKLRVMIEEGVATEEDFNKLNTILAKYKINSTDRNFLTLEKNSVRLKEIEARFEEIMEDTSITDEHCVRCLDPNTQLINFVIFVYISSPPLTAETFLLHLLY
ncbi:CLUMA_CG002930, isoform A [Clunio marinus]|uniref:CLUMA_CG002930, isoform A n=1 Tax=Clunio marinus TaxID=568069 RepID=A0A1J1HSK0_9DIPT|nr:CLUMA_CG002930, isoform A [Clunio marinus]